MIDASSAIVKLFLMAVTYRLVLSPFANQHVTPPFQTEMLPMSATSMLQMFEPL